MPSLALYRNISLKIAWTGGPSGPRFYSIGVSGFVQPYLTAYFVTQFNPLSFPGWKHARRAYPAIISCADVLLTVNTQDGRTFGPFTIPSTSGQYRQLPQMLPHGLKDLAFSFILDGQGTSFAFYPDDFVLEFKEWEEETYIKLAIWKA